MQSTHACKRRTLTSNRSEALCGDSGELHALQLDLQQNKAYNPFSAKSKQMIQDVGNEKLCELFETDRKTQCKACLSYWSEGIVYCTCGHLVKETVANRSFIVYTLDLLSIPEYVIKGRLHGHRNGKLPENKEYHQTHNLKKRWIKRQVEGIHDRFLRDRSSRRTRSHLSNVRIRILSLQAKLVDHSQLVRKQYPTFEKTF